MRYDSAPHNGEDVIDSRAVIERREELEAARDQLVEDVKDTAAALAAELVETATEPGDPAEAQAEAKAAQLALGEWAGEFAGELAALEKLTEEAAGYAPDWEYGATLVRHTHFADYCQELVQDCDGLPKDLPAYLVIDWAATAENLRADYAAVDFAGVEYWVR